MIASDPQAQQALAVEPVASPLEGVRWLRIHQGEDGTLRFSALNQPEQFDRVSQARCLAQAPHDAPDLECRCGIYACQGISELNSVTSAMIVRDVNTLIRADVTLWGRIIIHTGGVRAQFQQVHTITVPLAPCRHKADMLIPTGGERRAGASRRPGGRLCRVGCSRCDRGGIALTEAADQLGVRIQHDNTARPVVAAATSEEIATARLSAAATITWLALLTLTAVGAAVAPTTTMRYTTSGAPATITLNLLDRNWFIQLIAAHAVLALPLASWLSRKGEGLLSLVGRWMLLAGAGLVALSAVAATSTPERIRPEHITDAFEQSGLEITSYLRVEDHNQVSVRDGAGNLCHATVTTQGREAAADWQNCEPAAIR